MRKPLRLPDGAFGRYLRASGWMTAGSLAVQLLRLGRMWVLAWLLEPAFFGLAAIAWTVLYSLQEFTDTGIRQAFIQNPRALSRPFMDTYWTISLVRSWLLALVLLAIAPLVAGAYDNPDLVTLVRLSSLVLVFEGLSGAGLMALHKQVRVVRLKLIELSGQIVGISTTIVLAWFWKSPVVLIVGEVTVAAVMCLGGYLAHPWRPALRWHWPSVVSLVGYGMQLYLVELTMLMIFRVDVLVLGKVAPAAQLGLYTLSMTLVMAAVVLFRQVTVNVGFPTYAMLQEDLAQLRQLTRQTTLAIAPLAVVGFSLLGILAPVVVQVLPEKYNAIAPVLRALAPTGLFVVLSTLATGQLYALRRLRGCLWMAMGRLVIMGLLMLPAWQRWGVRGFCLAMDVATGVGGILIWVAVARVLRWRWRDLLRELAPVWVPLLAGGVAATVTGAWGCSGTGVAVRSVGWPWGVGLVVYSVVGVVVYYRSVAGRLGPGDQASQA